MLQLPPRRTEGSEGRSGLEPLPAPRGMHMQQYARHRRSPAVKTPPGPRLMPHRTRRFPCNTLQMHTCVKAPKFPANGSFPAGLGMTQPADQAKRGLYCRSCLLPSCRQTVGAGLCVGESARAKRATASSAGACLVGDEKTCRPSRIGRSSTVRSFLSASQTLQNAQCKMQSCAVDVRSENDAPSKLSCIWPCSDTPLSPRRAYHPRQGSSSLLTCIFPCQSRGAFYSIRLRLRGVCPVG